MTKTLIIFIVLNIINVIIQTAKSLVTVKCGKTVSALVNAIAYGLYTVVIVYTMADISLWLKSVVVAIANLIGVFVVKFVEEKTEKTRLWKVETAIPTEKKENFISALSACGSSFNYTIPQNSEYSIFNIFCYTKEESKSVKEILKLFNAKFFVTESKKL